MKKLSIILALFLLQSVLLLADIKTFDEANKGFQERWSEFGGDKRDFALWSPNLKESELKAKFDAMSEERFVIYFVNPEECRNKGTWGTYKETYKMPENWERQKSRYPFACVFDYNLATPDYNGSLIVLNGKRFLAMEAPSEANLAVFENLLAQYKVHNLVRLTPAKGDKRENCIPYWEGIFNVNVKTGRPTLMFQEGEVNYYFTDCWKDHEGIEPERLLAIIKAVESADDNSIMAVHCRAGVGRTGTFIVAYLLVQEIDKQIRQGVSVDKLQLNIDKLVYQIWLQRPFSVTKFSHYLSLYKLVNYYTGQLKK